MDTNTKEEFKWNPKFKSEFSMGQLDFIRYNKWLEFVEQWSSAVTSYDIPQLEHIQKLYSGLNILFKAWKVLISDERIRKKIKDSLLKIRKDKRLWENNDRNGIDTSNKFKFDLADSLDEVYEELMRIKQIIGLGIMVKKVLTTEQKIKIGVRGDKNLDDLPEA